MSPPLNKTPFFAAFPEATVMTVGVAKPNAQGHAITKTAMESWMAKLKKLSALLPNELCNEWFEFVINPLWACVNKSGQICFAPFHQKKKLVVAIKRTKYVNFPAIWSAILWIGGLLTCTDSIRFTSFAREVWSPTFTTWSLKVEFKFNEPFSKFLPEWTFIGLDSPVMWETSID